MTRMNTRPGQIHDWGKYTTRVNTRPGRIHDRGEYTTRANTRPGSNGLTGFWDVTSTWFFKII